MKTKIAAVGIAYDNPHSSQPVLLVLGRFPKRRRKGYVACTASMSELEAYAPVEQRWCQIMEMLDLGECEDRVSDDVREMLEIGRTPADSEYYGENLTEFLYDCLADYSFYLAKYWKCDDLGEVYVHDVRQAARYMPPRRTLLRSLAAR